MLNSKAAIFCAVCLMMLSACAGPDLPQAPKETNDSGLEMAPAREPYKLQVGDTLDIKVRFNPELNEQVIIPPDGVISTSLAEDVMAYGQSVKQLRTKLKKEYSRELKHPRVAVIIRSFAPNRVYVTGEVGAPGEFTTTGPNLTLLQAIARAGGLKDSAAESDIIIIRHGQGGEPKAYAVNYAGATNGKDPGSDVRLSPYDVVFVPRSGVANAYLYFRQFVQQFIPASFGMNYHLNQQSTISQ